MADADPIARQGASDDGEPGRYPKPSWAPVRVTGLTDIIRIQSGLKHALALRKDGTVWGWGTRDEGVLGDDSKPTTPGAFHPVTALAPIQVPGLSDITQVAAGPTHNLALRRDGRVVAWGANRYGQLGIGTRNPSWTPVEVPGLDHVVAIACGENISVALRDDGTVWQWGSNEATMMGGDGSISPDDPGGSVLVPMHMKGIVGAKSIGAGAGNIAALLGDGTIRTLGFDGFGQMGIGGEEGLYYATPQKPALSNVAALYITESRAFAVRADGTFWTWGYFHVGGQGILGKNRTVPTKLELP